MEELLEWPWLRFERFHTAFVIREIIERLERQRDAIVAALHANSVYDEHKEARRDEATRQIEEAFDEVVDRVRMMAVGQRPDDDEDDYDPESNPFWAAAERGAARLDTRTDEDDAGATAAEMVEGEQAAREVAEYFQARDIDIEWQ